MLRSSFKDKEHILFIDSIIYVERDTQKGIIIGHKGEAIKKVGTEARIDLEKFFGKKIHLNIFVKVKKDWRKNVKDLKKFWLSLEQNKTIFCIRDSFILFLTKV